MVDHTQNTSFTQDSSLEKKRPNFGKKLLLFMWKNVLLRRRHWILTTFEIVLPTLLFILLLTIRVLPDSIFRPSNVSTTSYFPPANEFTLREAYCNLSHGKWHTDHCRYPILANTASRRIFWGPPTNFTIRMIENIKNRYNFRNRDFESVETNEELNQKVDQYFLLASTSLTSHFLGLFFHVGEDDDDPPTDLSYDIRLQKIWFTELIFPFLQIPGPRNYTGDFSWLGSYNMQGFTLLQNMVTRAFIDIVTEDPTKTENIEIETQMYPYPPYVQDNGVSQFYGSALPTFVVLSLVLLCPSLIKSIVYEKETGVRELMRLMGMDGFLVWLGWFLHSFVMIILISSIITLLLKVSYVQGGGEANLPPILINTDWFILWIFLVLYGISCIAFCFAISCFFSRPTLATTIGVLAWLGTYFIPRSVMDYEYDDMGLAPKVLSCLLPNMAITWVFRVIAMFEGRAIGVQWNNLWDTGNPRDELTPAILLLMFVTDTVLYLFITWYVDQVLPGNFGVAKPWHFMFHKSYWCGASAEDNGSAEAEPSMEYNQSYFEEEPSNMPAGIIISNLRKVFKSLGGKTKVAVEDVTLKCYKGECTVLLGHNGAGKTTTMSVITGVYKASGGNAIVNGWDIQTHLKEARANIGLCPQHNMLFTDLTVKQHLIFFGKLKGLTRKEAEDDLEHLLTQLQLLDKRNMYGNQLSGGMKRKLCLAISLIGGSKVVILDEPSSGLDPESRRWVWNVIQQERGRRTILVTTHHMEEADVLGDRVAIMATGRVVCSGSTMFLKKKFGDGYSLILTVSSKQYTSSITEAVIKHLPKASLNTALGGELSYRLPEETIKFPPLLDYLSNHRDDLGIMHIGLSLTSMEQVFLNVGQLTDPDFAAAQQQELLEANIAQNNLQDINQSQYTQAVLPPELDHKEIGNQEYVELSVNSSNDSSDKDINDDFNLNSRLSGFSLFTQRIGALFKKRFIFSKRKFVLFLTQGLLPVIVTIMCLAVDASFDEQNPQEPSRKMSLDMFTDTTSFVESNNAKTEPLLEEYMELFNGPYKVSNTSDIVDKLIKTGEDDIFNYREKYVASALYFYNDQRDKIIQRMLYQSIPYHAPGVSMNLIDNALLRHLTGEDRSITCNNYPLPPNKSYQFGGPRNVSGSAMVYSMMMPLALAFLAASFLVFPLNERESKAKQIQVMTGTPAWSLWLTTFMWDLLTYTVSALLVLIFFMILDSKNFFKADDSPGALFMLLMLFGWGSIPMAYVFSFMFSTAATGFAILCLVNIVAGMIISVATWALYMSKDATLMTVSDVLGNITSLVPTFQASKAFGNLVLMSEFNMQCTSEIIDEDTQKMICEFLELKPSLQFSSPFTWCCPNCANLGNGTCFEKMSHFDWTEPGIGKSLVWMVVDGLLFFMFVLLVEAKLGSLISKAWEGLFRSKKMNLVNVVPPTNIDDDVRDEAEIANTCMDTDTSEISLVVNGLTKVFLKAGVLAVRNLSFKVKRGECLGLLGVNGAGKTTTFKMLTGDEVPTAGDARIGSAYLSRSMEKFVKEIGYCPQFDALLGELTGEEMMDLLASLRGVPSKSRRQLIEQLVVLVGLTECAKRPSSTYSGGNKRKLSTGIALIGGSPLVFLDEPTSGVDPAARRRVWSAVRAVCSTGQSVILTSHSMEECEALCSRVAILTKGYLRCIGTTQHLKAKYGQGYSLQIKLKPPHRPDSETKSEEIAYQQELEKLQSIILRCFPGSSLSDRHRGMIAYRVPSTVSWADLFTIMEGLKEGKDVLNNQGSSFSQKIVEDYIATDTSLEQVFLSFARESERENNLTHVPNDIISKF